MNFAQRLDAERFIRMLAVFVGDGDRAAAAVAGANLAVKTVREVADRMTQTKQERGRRGSPELRSSDVAR